MIFEDEIVMNHELGECVILRGTEGGRRIISVEPSRSLTLRLYGAQGDHQPITLALQLSAPVTSRDRRPARRARGGLIDIRKSQNAAEPMDNLHLSVDS